MRWPNDWLGLAPHAQAVCSDLGAMVDVNDFATRPALGLACFIHETCAEFSVQPLTLWARGRTAALLEKLAALHPERHTLRHACRKGAR